MKIHLNLVDFYDDISPQQEIIDSTYDAIKLIPFGKSGIHIKKENRGSFTSYCGGKVTDACIQKGKNSPSAAIRKKATFAANARKWKHQNGGVLIPGAEQDISNLFVDVPDLTPFEKKQLKKDPFKLDDSELFNINPIQNIIQRKVVNPEDDLSIDNINLEQPIETNTESNTKTNTNNQNNDFSVRIIDNFDNAVMPEDLRARLAPHNHKLAGKAKSGVYDCSDVARKVYADYGLSGNSDAIYHQTTPIEIKDLKPGDLIYLQGTQNRKGATHVAIVTNTDRLGDNIIEVFQGTPSKENQPKYTGLREWNLNSNYFKTHLYGAGRLKTKIAKYGMKFGLGGYLVDVPIFTPPIKRNEPTFDLPDLPSLYETPQYQIEQVMPEVQDIIYNPIVQQQPTQQQPNYSKIKGYKNFKKQFDLYTQTDPSAKKYEKVLTDIAQHESGFNPTIQNSAGAPAFGYFQFWQDGKINNITHFSGLNIKDFLNNPQAQIAAAVRMARSIEHSWNKEDIRLASAMGYSSDALIRGAWLGGVSGVRKVLRGLGNPNDAKWYKDKNQGRSVKQVMDEQNNLL